MIFPNLRFENIVQVDDKFRLDASDSFVTADETVQDVLIEAEFGAGFISIYNVDPRRWNLDYAYEVDGTKEITLRIVTDNNTKDKNYSIECLSEINDALLSDDNDLYPYEPLLSNYLPVGKNSFKYAHRAAQTKILSYLDENRIWRNDGSIYTKQDLVDVQGSEFKDQFKLWSAFEALLIILESSQVSDSDIFQEKKEEYALMRNRHRNRAALSLDQDGDGVVDEDKLWIKTARFVRR
jgi:hypothetical protein